MKVNKLDWDSDFFGLRIGKADIVSDDDGKILASQADSLREGYDLVYVFAHHGLEFAAPNAKLVDIKTVYSLRDFTDCEKNSKVMVWDGKSGVTDELFHLALVSGEFSRFKIDGHFPTGSFERLYSRWIEQSVNQTMASEVFCYMVEDLPRGLITLNRKGNEGTIGLVAIHESFQHRGIGSAMMRHVIWYAREHHCDRLSVATQRENVSACKFYEKAGFLVESETDVWHWWMGK